MKFRFCRRILDISGQELLTVYVSSLQSWPHTSNLTGMEYPPRALTV